MTIYYYVVANGLKVLTTTSKEEALKVAQFIKEENKNTAKSEIEVYEESVRIYTNIK